MSDSDSAAVLVARRLREAEDVIERVRAQAQQMVDEFGDGFYLGVGFTKGVRDQAQETLHILEGGNNE